MRSGHEMGNKMGTATPERRKGRAKDSAFVKVLKDSGRKKRLAGSASSSAEVLDVATPAGAVSTPSECTDVPERVARFPRPGPDSPVTAEPPPRPPDRPPEPPTAIESPTSFVTDSWKQVGAH